MATISDNFKEITTTSPEGLAVVVRSGRITGAGAEAHFNDAVRANFRAAYPVARNAHKQELQYNASRDELVYTLTATALCGPLPQGGGVSAVEGKSSVTTRSLPTGRRLSLYSHDLATSADPADLLPGLRPAGAILEEETQITSLPGWRLVATFTVVAGVDGSDLLDWENAIVESEDVSTATYTYTQTGRAVGAGKFPREPAFVRDGGATPVMLSFDRLNSVECETKWRYSTSVSARQAVTAAEMAALPRPVTPTLYEEE